MRTVGTVLVALASLGFSPTALAGDPRPPPPPRVGMEMTFTQEPGTESCPTRSAMRDYLIGEYAYDPFDFSREDVHILVNLTLSRRGGQYHGAYTVARADGEIIWVQEMDNPRCSEVLKDIANAIPVYTDILFPAPRPEPPPPPLPPPPALPPPPSSLPPLSPATAKPGHDTPAAAPAVQRPSPPPGSPWVASVEPTVALGLVPGVGLGGGASLDYRWSRYSLGVVAYGVATLGASYGNDRRLRRGTFFEGMIMPCAILSRESSSIFISSCVAVGLGSKAVSIFPTTDPMLLPEAHVDSSIGVGLRVQIERKVGGSFMLGASIQIGTRVWSRSSLAPPSNDATSGRHDYLDHAGWLTQTWTPILMGGPYIAAHL